MCKGKGSLVQPKPFLKFLSLHSSLFFSLLILNLIFHNSTISIKEFRNQKLKKEN